MSFLAQLANRRVLVVGGGVTGHDVAQFLHAQAAHTYIFDDRLAESKYPLLRSTDEVEGDFLFAVISPGFKFDHPVISKLKILGIDLISEIDLAWRVKEEINPDQIWLALTGTNGKTTAIGMLESIFSAAGINGAAFGNVGRTAIDAVMDGHRYEVLALELSSFQLAWSNKPEFAASAILNIAPDHIDWHGSFAEYSQAKLRIFQRSKVQIINLDDPTLSEIDLPASPGTQLIKFSLQSPAPGELGMVEDLLIDRALVTDPNSAEVLFELADIHPPVPHNVSNALAAAGLARAYGISYSAIARGLAEFKLDSHRIEFVANIDGVDWIDDSKATNPHAAAAALNSYQNIIWIAGGLAKGADMAPLIAKHHKRIKAAIVIGTDAEIIIAELKKYLRPEQIIASESLQHLRGQDLMREIVSLARSMSRAGDTVLLAPACASMDQFKSYAERGSLFAGAVATLNHQNPNSKRDQQ